MPRRMSVSMTVDQVRARRKLVTRRHKDTWKNLQPGDRVTLIEKGMGLPKGAKQTVICDVEIVDVRVEPLHLVYDEGEVALEGFDMEPGEFMAFWCDGHGYRPATQDEMMSIECRRIEWRYLVETDEGLVIDVLAGTPWVAPTWSEPGTCRCGGPLPPKAGWHNPTEQWSHIVCPGCGWEFVDEDEFLAVYDLEALDRLAYDDDHHADCTVPTAEQTARLIEFMDGAR